MTKRPILLIAMTALAVLASSRASAQFWPGRSPRLAARADSIQHLDVRTEVRHAVQLGDLSFRAVCRTSCFPPGISVGTLTYTHVSIIEGTTDHPANQDERRLNAVALRYATAYNRLMLPFARHSRNPDRMKDPDGS